MTVARLSLSPKPMNELRTSAPRLLPKVATYDPQIHPQLISHLLLQRVGAGLVSEDRWQGP